MKSPCMHCIERFLGCHSICEQYAEYCRYREELNNKRRIEAEESLFHNTRYFAKKK